MPILELTLEETGDMYLLLDATTLPTLHVPPTNKQNCRDPHRRDNLRFVSKVLATTVQRRVPLLSRNCARADRESDVG